MAHGDRILAQTLETQRRIGRLAKRDYGLDLKRISIDSGIPYPTVRSYFSQARDVRLSELPVTAFIRLCGVIPDELLSQLLSPADRHLEADDEDEDSAYDDLAEMADEVTREVRRARHPESPGGVEIIAIEEERIKRAQGKLSRRNRRLRSVA